MIIRNIVQSTTEPANKFDLWLDTSVVPPAFRLYNSSGWEVVTSNVVEISHSDLLNMVNQGRLIPGLKYRIIDYNFVIDRINCSSGNHPFDIIVEALDEHTLSEDAKAALHEGDEYFATEHLEAWELKYCIYNDTTRFNWACEEGKGVIYRLTDQQNNSVGYDFKNCKQYTRYLFDYNGDGSLSYAREYDNVNTYNNYIGDNASTSYYGTFTYSLPSVRIDLDSTTNCYGIKIGNNCTNISLCSSYEVTIGNFCRDISINIEGRNVIIGNMCRNITCNYIHSCSIGNNCTYVYLDIAVASNIGNNCVTALGGLISCNIGDGCEIMGGDYITGSFIGCHFLIEESGTSSENNPLEINALYVTQDLCYSGYVNLEDLLFIGKTTQNV